MDLTIVFACVTVFITVFTFFYKLVIQPLQSAILDLKEFLQELQKDLRDENEKRNKIDIRLSIVEEKIENLIKQLKK